MRRIRLITVCDRCLRASCWHGEFMCEVSSIAGTVQKTAAELRRLNREHPIISAAPTSSVFAAHQPIGTPPMPEQAEAVRVSRIGRWTIEEIRWVHDLERRVATIPEMISALAARDEEIAMLSEAVKAARREGENAAYAEVVRQGHAIGRCEGNDISDRRAVLTFVDRFAARAALSSQHALMPGLNPEQATALRRFVGTVGSLWIGPKSAVHLSLEAAGLIEIDHRDNPRAWHAVLTEAGRAVLADLEGVADGG